MFHLYQQLGLGWATFSQVSAAFCSLQCALRTRLTAYDIQSNTEHTRTWLSWAFFPCSDLSFELKMTSLGSIPAGPWEVKVHIPKQPLCEWKSCDASLHKLFHWSQGLKTNWNLLGIVQHRQFNYSFLAQKIFYLLNPSFSQGLPDKSVCQY